MEKRKIILDRAKPSAEEIAKYREFDKVLKNFNAARKPWYQSGGFMAGVLVIAAIAISSVIYLNRDSDEQIAESNSQQEVMHEQEQPVSDEQVAVAENYQEEDMPSAETAEVREQLAEINSALDRLDNSKPVPPVKLGSSTYQLSLPMETVGIEGNIREIQNMDSIRVQIDPALSYFSPEKSNETGRDTVYHHINPDTIFISATDKDYTYILHMMLDGKQHTEKIRLVLPDNEYKSAVIKFSEKEKDYLNKLEKLKTEQQTLQKKLDELMQRNADS